MHQPNITLFGRLQSIWYSENVFLFIFLHPPHIFFFALSDITQQNTYYVKERRNKIYIYLKGTIVEAQFIFNLYRYHIPQVSPLTFP